MSIANSIIRGKINVPDFLLIFGTDSVGKSSFGAGAPNPIFLEIESGSNFLDVARFPVVKNFKEVQANISFLTTEEHDFKTLVVDSLDWLEPLVWARVCDEQKVKSIEECGYGKGYVFALSIWQEFISSLKLLRSKRNMNIVLIAHSHIKPFNDPSQPAAYDRFMLKLNDKASALFREAVDAVFFATFETFVKSDGNKKAKAFGDGRRVIYTERRPAWDAKNRMGLPFEMPLSWASYVEAKSASKPDNLKVIKQDIEDLIEACEKADKKKLMTAAYKNAGDDAEKLNEVLNRIRVTLGGN